MCRPVMRNKKNEIEPVKLPYPVADMYLALYNEWGLPPLAGISTSPLLELTGQSATVKDMPLIASCGAEYTGLVAAKTADRRRCRGGTAQTSALVWTFPFADAVRKSDGLQRSKSSISITRRL